MGSLEGYIFNLQGILSYNHSIIIITLIYKMLF